jgi:hypothetical protein
MGFSNICRHIAVTVIAAPDSMSRRICSERLSVMSGEGVASAMS